VSKWWATVAAGATVAALLLLAPAAARADGHVRAGVAAVDASWHVGASAGQYASDGSFVSTDQGVDPTMHSTKRASSYGIQARLSVRALVTEGSNGQRVALVKDDLYIPEDLLTRRVAQILEAHGTSGITRRNLTIAVTHDHSSPMYSSPSWGVWAFQDVIDVRFFNYYAQRMAAAVEQAAAHMRPVSVGAEVVQFDKTHRHSFGPAVADDGTPAGYPNSDADHSMTVVRYDDVSDRRHPKPLATLVNFSLHPEMLNGNDLISADYLGPLQRIVDRRTGATTIWTQNAVGTAEPERSSYHSMHERLEFTHKEYGQAEYAAHLMAEAILGAWRHIPSIRRVEPGRAIPPSTSFPVEMQDRWYPGPISHPYPAVSNCRTDTALGGDPQLPVVGLPDCTGPSGSPVGGDVFKQVQDAAPVQDTGLSTDDFERAGIPVPENYGAPGYSGLEESLGIHLQAFRMGDMLFTVCACEQWKDQAFNIKTRTDRVAGNEYVGYDWKEQCTPNDDGGHGDGPEGYGSGTWDCPDPRNPGAKLAGLSDQKVQRMHAQVTNPADGWNDPSYASQAESEPTDVRQIKGNFTHDDDGRSAALGYDLTVPISMANDYNGYIASYREFSDRDHYRKALTGWGPHSSDYLASRLVWLGRHMRDGGYAVTDASDDMLAAKIDPDQAAQDAKAEAIGNAGAAATSAYDATLPADGGKAEPVRQPGDVERFGAALFTWNGGSNYTDNPDVKVQRLVDGQWRNYADQSGEIPVTVKYPGGADMPAYLTGGQPWEWTATFEAFVSRFDVGSGALATPAGTYRFVVEGQRREGLPPAPRPYRVESSTFAVRPWSGITADDLRVEPDGTVSFAVGPRHAFDVTAPGGAPVHAEVGPIDYPDTYQSPVRFVKNERTPEFDPAAPGDPSKIEWYCLTCSFRPWLDASDASTARATYAAASGRVRTVRATKAGGRWRTTSVLKPNEAAYVAAGQVRDPYGNFNGQQSARVSRP
jgi:Neutral/alkaline non-lysosomal ceramidase, N-terminal